MDLHGLPATYANDYVKKIYAVTPQQVSEPCAQHLQDDQATIVVVGDRKVIEEQVKPFGKIVPVTAFELVRSNQPARSSRPRHHAGHPLRAAHAAASSRSSPSSPS